MAKTKRLSAEQLGKQVEKTKSRLAELRRTQDEIKVQIEKEEADLENITNAWKARLWDDYQASLDDASAALEEERGGDLACSEEENVEK